MDEDRFWGLIEQAWQDTHPELEASRAGLAAGSQDDDAGEALQAVADDVVGALKGALESLSQEDLLAFDRILERLLHRIDRAEIHAQTDGSDDGFLYARGFIVLAGRGYYQAVDAKPETAVMDMECEALTYVSWHLYAERFGEVPSSEISRETGSNAKGWT